VSSLARFLSLSPLRAWLQLLLLAVIAIQTATSGCVSTPLARLLVAARFANHPVGSLQMIGLLITAPCLTLYLERGNIYPHTFNREKRAFCPSNLAFSTPASAIINVFL
jgi:hypothetical protein